MNDPRPGASNSDSFWAPQDVDETSHELEEFYSEFFENNDKLKAEIIGHEILEGNGNKFTVKTPLNLRILILSTHPPLVIRH